MGEILIAGAFFLLGFAVMLGGLSYGFGAFGAPGTGFVPTLSGIALSFFSLLWFMVILLGKQVFSTVRWFEERESLKKVLLTLLALGGYAVLLDPLGFILCTFLFLTFLLRIVEPGPWFSAIRMALIVSIVCFLVFQLWLQVQLPEGLVKVYRIRKWIL